MARRFVVLSSWGGDALLDRETGLVWERDPQTARGASGARHNDANAAAPCVQATPGGRTGWHLPAISELHRCTTPAAPSGWMLRVGHPFLDILTDAFANAQTVDARCRTLSP